jgi:hypothetical protein
MRLQYHLPTPNLTQIPESEHLASNAAVELFHARARALAALLWGTTENENQLI